jgi:hypothetical protein
VRHRGASLWVDRSALRSGATGARSLAGAASAAQPGDVVTANGVTHTAFWGGECTMVAKAGVTWQE